MNLIVAPDLAARLRTEQSVLPGFVAGCAERVGQFFTGTVGLDEVRADDVAQFVSLLDGLWDPTTSRRTMWEEGVQFLEDLPEVTSEEEIVEDFAVAAFFAIAVARSALLARISDDVEEALLCGHSGLTLLGLFRGDVGPGAFDDEHRLQHDDAFRSGDSATRRSRDQEVGRIRFHRLTRAVDGRPAYGGWGLPPGSPVRPGRPSAGP